MATKQEALNLIDNLVNQVLSIDVKASPNVVFLEALENELYDRLSSTDWTNTWRKTVDTVIQGFKVDIQNCSAEDAAEYGKAYANVVVAVVNNPSFHKISQRAQSNLLSQMEFFSK